MSLKQGALMMLAAAFVAATVVYLMLRQSAPGPEPGPAPLAAVDAGTRTVSAVYLYFGDPQTEYLNAETRSLSHTEGPEALARTVVEALIAGPATDRVATIPRHTVLNAVYLTDDGIAYVDLSKAVVDENPGGAHSELMTVFSIVNSLVLNIEQIQRVKILIDGMDAATLAGHIDLRYPLAANMLIVR